MRIAVAGSSGLVGRALVRALRERGDSVLRLVRGPVRDPSAEASFDPRTQRLDPAVLRGVDAVVDLAGANVAEGRWTKERRAVLRSSRIDTALALGRAAAESGSVRVFLQASAIGYHGPRPAGEVDESSPAGEGFLAQLCVDWEAAAREGLASSAKVRLVIPRLGVVLAKEGGALPKMARPFRLFVGGPIGDGERWLSFLSLEDCVRGLLHLLDREDAAGAYVLSGPSPVRNAELARNLGELLHRPSWLAVPPLALRLLLGRDFADETLLSSARALPRRLLAEGFRFRHADLESALRAAGL